MTDNERKAKSLPANPEQIPDSLRPDIGELSMARCPDCNSLNLRPFCIVGKEGRCVVICMDCEPSITNDFRSRYDANSPWRYEDQYTEDNQGD